MEQFTTEELIAELIERGIPEETDNDGQIVIYTGKQWNDERDQIVDFIAE